MTMANDLTPDGSLGKPPILEIVQLLTEHLGRQLLAITVDVRPAIVDSWLLGQVHPEAAAERRLRAAHDVCKLVLSVESTETTRAWWMGMKEQLDDLSPAEAIAADRERAVMSIARDFVEGG